LNLIGDVDVFAFLLGVESQYVTVVFHRTMSLRGGAER
jgi:hypothetical protein